MLFTMNISSNILYGILFLLLSGSIWNVSSTKSACVEVCPSSQDPSECKASVDILSSVPGQAHKPSILTIYPSTSLTLEASVNFRGKCYESYSAQWTWSIIDDQGFRLKFRGISLNNSILEIPPKTLDVGKYVLRANVTLTKPTECISLNTVQDYLKVSGEISINANTSKLIVILTGGTKKYVFKNVTFNLNASKTHDPTGKVNKSKILYAHACVPLSQYGKERKLVARKKDKFSGTSQSRYALRPRRGVGPGVFTGSVPTEKGIGGGICRITKTPRIPKTRTAPTSTTTTAATIKTIPTTTTSPTTTTPNVTTEIRPVMEEDRYFAVNDSSTKRPSVCRGLRKPFSYSNSSVITLNPNDFPPPEKYVFRVYATVPSGDYKQYVSKEQTVEFVDYKTGEYDIVCEKNCNPKIRIGSEIKLRAECSQCLLSGFEWRIDTISDKGVKKNVPILWKFQTEFEKNHSQLVLHPGALNLSSKISKIRSVNFSLFTPQGNPLVSKLIPTAVTAFSWRCEVWPEEGWELVTEFTINCTDLSPDKFRKKWEDIVYFEYGQKVKTDRGKKSNNIILRYSSLPWATNVRLLAGDPETNFKSNLRVTMVEKYGVITTIPIEVVVRPICLKGGCISTKPECLFKLVTDSKEGSNYFASLGRMGKHQIAINTAHVIIHMLNRDSHLTSTSQLAKIRHALVLNAGACTRLSLPSIKQVLYFVGSVFHASNPKEIIYGTQSHSLQVVEKCVEKLEKQHPETMEFQKEEIRHLVKHSCKTLSDIFLSFHSARTVTSPDNMILPLMHFEKILHSVTEALFNYIGVNELGDLVYTDYFNLSIQKVMLLYLIGVRFGYVEHVLDMEQLGHFRIPEAPKTRTSLTRLNVSVQLVQFRKNPLVLGIKHATNQHILPLFLNIRNLASHKLITSQLGPIDYYLTCIGCAPSTRYHGITVDKEHFDDDDIQLHHVSMPPSNETRSVMLSVSLQSASQSLQVVMRERWEPRVEDFSNRSTVNILTKDNPLTLHKREDVAFYRIAPSNKSSTLYAGILPSPDSAKKLFEESKKAAGRPVLLYYATMRVVDCLHYNYRYRNWTTKGCSVVTDGLTSTAQLHCRCESMSRFAGQSVDLSTSYYRNADDFDFYLNVPFNLVIVIFLLVLVILFALLFLLATYMDSKKSYKLGVTVVEDNDPMFRYSYLISVSTASSSDSGTTSVPAIQLHGEDGASNVHVLVDSNRHLLRTGSTDHFMITTEKAIKNINSMTLVQKPVPPSPSWNLLRIVVSDLMADGVWEFLVNEELKCESVKPLNREYEGQPVAAGSQDRIVSVTERIQKRFEDDFIWTSVFFRAVSSPFTSVQRALCVILLILLAFFINLLVRGLPEHTPTQHIGVYGFRVRLRDFVFGLITAVILLIFVIVVVYVMKAFFSKLVWRVYIDLSNDWNKHAKKGLVLPGKKEPMKTVAAGVAPMEEPGAARKERPLRHSEGFLLGVRKSSRTYEISMEERAKQRLMQQQIYRPIPPSLPEQTSSVEDGQAKAPPSDTGKDVTMEEEDGDRLWYCQGRGCVWILMVIFIVVLVVLLYVLGHWYSETQTLLWIFSSLVSLFICIFLLHPLLIVIVATVLPLKNTLDKDSLRKVGLSSIMDKRQALIREKGTLEEFRQYLKFLRQQPIYNAKITSVKKFPLQNASQKEQGKPLERAHGKATEKTHGKALDGERWKTTEKTQQKGLEGERWKTPEKTQQKGLEGERWKTPEKTQQKGLEGERWKTPEKTQQKGLEGERWKTPEKTQQKGLEGGRWKTPEKTQQKGLEGKTPDKTQEKGLEEKTPEKTHGKAVEKTEEKGLEGKTTEQTQEKGLEGKTSEKTQEKGSEGKTPDKTQEKGLEGKTPEKTQEKDMEGKTPEKTHGKAPEETQEKGSEGKTAEKTHGKSPEKTQNKGLEGKTPENTQRKA